MRHESIIKQNDGSRIKIVINISPTGNGLQYRSDVFTCLKGKRTWNEATNTNCYNYRGLSIEDRVKVDLANQLRLVSEDELHAAKLQAWQKLKPEKT